MLNILYTISIHTKPVVIINQEPVTQTCVVVKKNDSKFSKNKFGKGEDEVVYTINCD